MNQLPSLCLSIRGPWWWFILHGGALRKDHENRSWPDDYRDREMGKLRGTDGWFLVHASSGMTMEEYQRGIAFARERVGLMHVPSYKECRAKAGGIVGVARTSGYVADNKHSPWATGPGLKLVDSRPLPFFTPCKGTLGFFRLPPGVAITKEEAHGQG
jgi:hypothetical protein